MRELPVTGLVLEIASGTGQHAVFFARRFPSLIWQPSDPDTEALSSIAEWAIQAGLANLLAPLGLDASEPDWPVTKADAVLCINMVHISPWSATKGLFAGASRLLEKDRALILYGPYREHGVETASSNEAFDQSLKQRNPEWGLRQAEDMDALAQALGFNRTARYAMPANNLMLVYRQA